MSKPLIRVTTLEAFRRWYEQSDYDNFIIDEQSVIDSVLGRFEGNDLTRIGTAFHSIVETGRPMCEPVAAGVREFTYYNKPAVETVPAGRKFDIDGHDICLDVAQCRVALDYRNEHPQAIHEYRGYKDFGPAVVTGCADMIDGMEIRDIKTKYSAPQDTQYRNSCQWRFYLDIFGLDVFHFDLFVFDGYKSEKHGADVRGLTLYRHDPITCIRYQNMEQENRELLEAFLWWTELRGIREQLKQIEQ